MYLCALQTGRTTPETSLFLYPPDTAWADYNNLTFIPLFLDELIRDANQTFLEESRQMCGDNSICLFDALATQDLAVGQSTMSKDAENQENAKQLGEIT